MTNNDAWTAFCSHLYSDPSLGISLDVSRMGVTDEFIAQHAARLQSAFAAMDRLEVGDIANADERRMVGHYWLRAPKRAPHGLIKKIDDGIAAVESFAKEILNGGRFKHLLLIGIGGSMLGPQFLAQALEADASSTRLRMHFIDNTDIDGIDRALLELDGALDRTLVVVVSKSGGTPETWNGMLEVEAAYEAKGLSIADHAVAVTE